MCRSSDFQGFYFNSGKDRLKLKSFFVRFLNFHAKNKLPDSLTLVYLPRINETALEISGKDIRPDTPSFVTLHRVVTAKTEDSEVIYGSREPVVVTEAVSFEVYFREEKVLKGIFRKDEEEEWKLQCKCVLEREIGNVAGAEICVGLDGHLAMIEKVEMVVKRNKNRRREFCKFELDEIPEERVGVDFECESVDCCCCCLCGEMESASDGEDERELDVEVVRWAVDVGIWVMCLGVGYLVSKASAKSLRRKRVF